MGGLKSNFHFSIYRWVSSPKPSPHSLNRPNIIPQALNSKQPEFLVAGKKRALSRPISRNHSEAFTISLLQSQSEFSFSSSNQVSSSNFSLSLSKSSYSNGGTPFLAYFDFCSKSIFVDEPCCLVNVDFSVLKKA
jgi:hypothetical protein